MSLLQQDDDQVDPNKNYLEELVGEGKKFKSPEDLARGKAEADAFIATKNRAFDELSADYARLKADYDARAKLEELLDQMKDKQLASTDNTDNGNGENKAVYDPKQVEALVASKFQEMEMTKLQQQNYNDVKNKLVQQYGNNYASAVKSQLDQLNVSEDLFESLAKNNPKLLYRTLGLDQPKAQDGFQPPPSSSVRGDNFTPMGKEKRSWSYYQKMKQDNFKKWSDPKTQMQMNWDYQELGDSFEDGDFHSSSFR